MRWTVVAVVLASRPAAAFEYWEHRELTDEALAALCAGTSGPPCDGAARLATLLDPTGDLPMTLGDVAAISGDHDVDPGGLLTRFFVPGRRRLVTDVLVGEAPERVRQPPVDRPGFLAASRDPRYDATADDWQACAAAKKAVWDGLGHDGALAWDGAYGANAAHDASHFRYPGSVSPEWLWARRAEQEPGLPALHALSTYADAHAGALLLARLAATSGRDDAAVAAVALEGFALHFLQDAMSAGHIGGAGAHLGQRPGRFLRTDAHLAGARLPMKRKRTHDARNLDGAWVQLTPAASTALGEPYATAPVRWHGDGIVGCTEGRAEERLATEATRRSLAELGRAATDGGILPAEPSWSGCDAPFAASDPLAAPYALLCGWWYAPEADAGAAREVQIKALWLGGYFEAVSLLPLPEPAAGGRGAPPR